MKYGIDLRKKVISYLERGGQIIEACEIFSVSRSSVFRWLRKKRLSGDVYAEPWSKSAHKLQDSELIKYIQANPDAYLSEIANHFNASSSGVCRALKRLNITRKKRRPSMQKEMN